MLKICRRHLALFVACLVALAGAGAPSFAQTVYDSGSGYSRKVPVGSVLTDQNGNAMASAITATIANGASVSGTIDLGTTRLFAIQMPAAWTTANLTFLAGTVAADSNSCVSATFNSIYDDTGTELSVTAAASQYIVMATPGKWLGIRCLQVRSGTSGTPVTQGGARALTIVGVP